MSEKPPAVAPQQLMQTRWIVAAVPERPAGGGYPVPKESDFQAVWERTPTDLDLAAGDVLVKTHFLSPDPYIVSMIMVKPETPARQNIWARWY